MARILEDDIRLGEAAFCTGKPQSANPHIVGTSAWGRWFYGWTKAEKESLK